MQFLGILLAAALVAAAPFPATDGANRTQSLADDMRKLQSIGQNSVEPSETPVAIGDPAPDFSFEAHDRQWLHLHDLLLQGSVLLVFGAEDSDLVAIQAERDALLDRGIVPVAVLDRRGGATWSAANRLNLKYSLLSDPRSVIAAQFNVLDPNTHHPVGSWFVVDQKGIVRGLKREPLPAAGYLKLATAALALPESGISLPARTR